MCKVLIVLSGQLGDQSSDRLLQTFYKKCDQVIAVDGGLHHCLTHNFKVDLFFGDRDSLSEMDRAMLERSNFEKHLFSSVKDAADGELALQYALDQGYDEIYVIGSIGHQRFDHVLANIQMFQAILQQLNYRHAAALTSQFEQSASLKNSMFRPRLYMTDGQSLLYFVEGEETLSFDTLPIQAFEDQAIYISIVPLSPSVYITESSGLFYPLKHINIRWGSSLGVSNEPVGSLKDVHMVFKEYNQGVESESLSIRSPQSAIVMIVPKDQ